MEDSLDEMLPEQQDRRPVTHGVLREFKVGHEWSFYKNRLTCYFEANGVTSPATRKAIFINQLSEDAYRLLRDLAAPHQPEDLTFPAATALFDKHFVTAAGSFAQRYSFYKAVRRPEEGATEWAARLRGLSIGCEFGGSFDVILRDKFIMYFDDKDVMNRLFEEDPATLTFEGAIKIARARIQKKKNLQEDSTSLVVQYSREVRRAGRAKECPVCGRQNHSARDCYFKGMRCRRCGQKGQTFDARPLAVSRRAMVTGAHRLPRSPPW